LKTFNVTDVSRAVMIGDRKFDIEGANYFKMDSIGVTYGYGSKEELESEGATYIVDSPSDILELL
ncbi:MAG: HAD hydrolase-like protein, partial [Clostridia bacterium]|nr:HAD hydrolase-like protein [Clostridia bacterium]